MQKHRDFVEKLIQNGVQIHEKNNADKEIAKIKKWSQNGSQADQGSFATPPPTRTPQDLSPWDSALSGWIFCSWRGFNAGHLRYNRSDRYNRLCLTRRRPRRVSADLQLHLQFHLYSHLHLHLYVHLHLHVHSHLQVRLPYVFICTCIYMFIYIYIYMFICICICIFIYSYMFIYVYICFGSRREEVAQSLAGQPAF